MSHGSDRTTHTIAKQYVDGARHTIESFPIAYADGIFICLDEARRNLEQAQKSLDASNYDSACLYSKAAYAALRAQEELAKSVGFEQVLKPIAQLIAGVRSGERLKGVQLKLIDGSTFDLAIPRN